MSFATLVVTVSLTHSLKSLYRAALGYQPFAQISADLSGVFDRLCPRREPEEYYSSGEEEEEEEESEEEEEEEEEEQEEEEVEEEEEEEENREDRAAYKYGASDRPRAAWQWWY